MSAVAQSLDDELAIELGEHARHLTHRSAHRVIRVVPRDLSGVDGEDDSTHRPNFAQDCFLHSECSSEAIETSNDQRISFAVTEELQRDRKSDTVLDAVGTTDPLVAFNRDDTMS